jgi:hypothetical protein
MPFCPAQTDAVPEMLPAAEGTGLTVICTTLLILGEHAPDDTDLLYQVVWVSAGGE